MSAIKDPQTPQEWQAAVDSAELFLLIDSAKRYGLITGPKVNADRCDEILSRGRRLGYSPRAHSVLLKEAFG